MDKKTLRRQIRELKAAMTEQEITEASWKLAQQFYNTRYYQDASVIYGYLPYNQEVRTVPILEQAMRDGKRVAVPKVYGDTMRFLYMNDLTATEDNGWGIPEPVDDDSVADDPTALVLMPGMAFDRAGNRMGYGGGFYDKFLAAEPDHPTVALCYDFQMVEHIPSEEYDIPVDLVLWASGKEA